MAAEDRTEPRELWTRLAWLPLALLLSGAVYLGLRPGGLAPVRVYQTGPTLLSLFALTSLLLALGYSALRRPFLRGGRVPALAVLAFAFGAAWMPFSYPTSHANRPSSAEFRLPFAAPVEEGGDGSDWIVRCGGKSWHTNALAFQPARCRGFDLVKRAGELAYPSDSGDQAPPPIESWYGFGEPVLAPAAGLVVSVHDAEPDLAAGARWSGGERFGNHVALRVAEGQFLFLTHLRRGSIAVSPGDLVEPGQRIAAVGSSGQPVIAADPHLGIHLQDTAVPGLGEGIPLFFSSYLEDERRVERGAPEGGLGLRGELSGARVRALSESGHAAD